VADLTGKTALVTGASRGIGRATALRLAADGAWVGVHYGTNEEAAKAVVADIEADGGRAFALRAEFGTDGDMEALFGGLERGLAGRRLDILVNNAGILDMTPLAQLTPEVFDHSFAVNVRAPLFVVQGALPLLRDGGRIINISSAVTRIAGPFLHYAMAKGAIEALGRTLAAALGPRGITVNTVAPGVVDTDMASWLRADPEIEPGVVATVALGRLGRPDDIADTVAFLASPDARWITGAVIDASGGQWLGPGGG
jgi:3-oxoacyl-[acyl-carrier protein] reductase